MGEMLLASWLKNVKNCKIVETNWYDGAYIQEKINVLGIDSSNKIYGVILFHIKNPDISFDKQFTEKINSAYSAIEQAFPNNNCELIIASPKIDKQIDGILAERVYKLQEKYNREKINLVYFTNAKLNEQIFLPTIDNFITQDSMIIKKSEPRSEKALLRVSSNSQHRLNVRKYSDLKEEFMEWMKDAADLTHHTINNYMSALNIVIQHQEEVNNEIIDLYNISNKDDIQKIQKLAKKYDTDGMFNRVGYEASGAVRAAIKKYAEFLEYKFRATIFGSLNPQQNSPRNPKDMLEDIKNGKVNYYD